MWPDSKWAIRGCGNMEGIQGTFLAWEIISCGVVTEKIRQTKVSVVKSCFIQNYIIQENMPHHGNGLHSQFNRYKYGVTTKKQGFAGCEISKRRHQIWEGFWMNQSRRYLAEGNTTLSDNKSGQWGILITFWRWFDIKSVISCWTILIQSGFYMKTLRHSWEKFRNLNKYWLNNAFSWGDFVGALGGLCKYGYNEVCGQRGNRWRSLLLGREGSGRSHGTWNKEETLGKISTVWVIASISLQWLQGDDFVNGQRSRNGEQGESTTCTWLG